MPLLPQKNGGTRDVSFHAPFCPVMTGEIPQYPPENEAIFIPVGRGSAALRIIETVQYVLK
jgi:hypothetical protein